MYNQLMTILKATTERYTTPLPEDATDAQKAIRVKRLEALSKSLDTSWEALSIALGKVPKAADSETNTGDSSQGIDVGDHPDMPSKSQQQFINIISTECPPVTPKEALSQVLKPCIRAVSVKEENKALQRLLCGFELNMRASKKGGKQWKSEYHSEIFGATVEGEVLMDNLRSTQRDYENMEAMRGNEENLEADEALMEKEEEIRQLKKAYTTAQQKFINKHGRIINTRKVFWNLYNEFGCAVLLDPFWDITGHGKYKAISRSKDFDKVVEELADGVETEEIIISSEDGEDEMVVIPVTARHEAVNWKVLVSIMIAIMQLPIAQWVDQLVTTFPSNMSSYAKAIAKGEGEDNDNDNDQDKE
ncbi:hypothetical protein EYR38_010519 [Pleurotus pulmonarius]|nr:hypothetical protein EYR38_010519 [Pleurotus pulmonarius]